MVINRALNYCLFECSIWYGVFLFTANRIEADEVFPGVESYCLYFSVENIEFDLPGTLCSLSDCCMQGDGTHICCVLRSSSAVKIKVKGQLEIFFEVNSQATISLRSSRSRSKQNFSKNVRSH